MKEKRPRVVIDTNVFVSGLIGTLTVGRSTIRSILTLLKEDAFCLIISPETFDEIIDVISREKFQHFITSEEIKELKELITTKATFVTPCRKIIHPLDPKDALILESAIAGEVDSLISGDRHLLSLKKFHNILILPPAEFLKVLKRT